MVCGRQELPPEEDAEFRGPGVLHLQEAPSSALMDFGITRFGQQPPVSPDEVSLQPEEYYSSRTGASASD